MRWKGVIFIVAVFVIVLVLGMIFSDAWFESRLEALGNSVVGARVEIDNLDLSLLGLHVRWDSLQVTNPRQTLQNILTTGRTEFDMQLVPLFAKNVIIDNVQIVNITSGTSRTYDGRLPRKSKRETPAFVTNTMHRLQELAGKAPVWNLDDLTKDINVDSILQLLDLESPERIDSLYTKLNFLYAKWDSTLNSSAWTEEFNQLSRQIQSLEPREIETVSRLQSTAAQIEKIYTRIDSLKTYAQNTADSLKNDLKFTRQQAALVDDWIAQDISGAMGKARLPSFTRENIGLFLFGPQIVNKINSVLQITGQVRHYSAKFKSDKPKKEKPPRFKGQTIHFAAPKVDPNFWIKQIIITGKTPNGLVLDGSIRHIVSRQSLIGESTRFSIQGRRNDQAALDMQGELNYLDDPQESLTLQLKEMPLAGVGFGESQWLPRQIKSGRGVLTARLKLFDSRIEGSLDLQTRALDFEFDEQTDDKWNRLIRSVFETAEHVDIKAELTSSESFTDFTIRSNVDDMMAQKVKKEIGDKAAQARGKIEQEIKIRVEDQKQELQALVDRRAQGLSRQMQDYQEKLTSIELQLEEKKSQILDRIESEKQKQSEKVKEKVKDLFK